MTDSKNALALLRKWEEAAASAPVDVEDIIWAAIRISYQAIYAERLRTGLCTETWEEGCRIGRRIGEELWEILRDELPDAGSPHGDRGQRA